MHKIILFINVCFFVISSVSNVYAASVCDIALSSGAFNTSDFTQSSSIFLSKRDDVCKSEYNSIEEAITASRNTGGGGSYGIAKIEASDVKKTKNEKYSVKDSRFCSSSTQELESDSSISLKKRVADIALKIWSKCISDTETSKLYVRYTPNVDATGFTGMIVRSLRSGPIGKITGIITNKSINNKDPITCKIGTQEINLSTKSDLDIQILKSRIGFTCSKSANTSVAIQLVTSIDDQNWINLDSITDMEKANEMRHKITKSPDTNKITWVKLTPEEYFEDTDYGKSIWALTEMKLINTHGQDIHITHVDASSCFESGCNGNGSKSNLIDGVSDNNEKYWAPSYKGSNSSRPWIKLFFNPTLVSAIKLRRTNGWCYYDCCANGSNDDNNACKKTHPMRLVARPVSSILAETSDNKLHAIKINSSAKSIWVIGNIK